MLKTIYIKSNQESRLGQLYHKKKVNMQTNMIVTFFTLYGSHGWGHPCLHHMNVRKKYILKD